MRNEELGVRNEKIRFSCGEKRIFIVINVFY